MRASDADPEDPEDRFRRLYARHVRDVLAYALRRVVEPADAADVVAETFLVAWRRVDEVPPDGEARLWLFGVARRVLANQRRGALRRSNLADRLRDELSGLVVPDHSSASTSAAVVRTAVGRLDEDDRELLWLTSWEGLAPAEIAVVLDVAPATARTRLHRARGRLRAQLDAVGWDGERAGPAGHAEDDGHVLVQDLRGER